MTGLRERKKRQTRQHISDVATGLFLERGFDEVTIAEIAEAADVSVNTVYNYFPAKEDLFFDREEEVVHRPSERVRARRPGESAAEALLRELRADIDQRNPWIGLSDVQAQVMRVIFSSPTLTARLMRMQHRTVCLLAETLREEVGAPPEDHEPELVASQLMGTQGVLARTAGSSVVAGVPLDDVARLMAEKLDTAEALLSPRVLGYARRAV